MPAAAVTRRGRALFGIIGRKGRAGGSASLLSNGRAQHDHAVETAGLESTRGCRNSRCRGEICRYLEEHQWRRQASGDRLTLRREGAGSKQV